MRKISFFPSVFGLSIWIGWGWLLGFAPLPKVKVSSVRRHIGGFFFGIVADHLRPFLIRLVNGTAGVLVHVWSMMSHSPNFQVRRLEHCTMFVSDRFKSSYEVQGHLLEIICNGNNIAARGGLSFRSVAHTLVPAVQPSQGSLLLSKKRSDATLPSRPVLLLTYLHSITPINCCSPF